MFPASSVSSPPTVLNSQATPPHQQRPFQTPCYCVSVFVPSHAADCTVQAWEMYTLDSEGCEMFNPDVPFTGCNYLDGLDSALCVLFLKPRSKRETNDLS